jgi:hypothetical protein
MGGIKIADPAMVPCAHERRGETGIAVVTAMNSRRFIRSSSLLEKCVQCRWSVIFVFDRMSEIGYPRRSDRGSTRPVINFTKVTVKGIEPESSFQE